MTQLYTTCWHIFRLNNKDTNTTAEGRACPCQHDPIKNPLCKDYEAVIIHDQK